MKVIGIWNKRGRLHLDRLKIIENIKRYQNGGYFHPLTCPVDSFHELLKPELLDDQVILKCPTCNFIQWENQIPEMFLDESLKEAMDVQDEYYRMFFKSLSE